MFRCSQAYNKNTEKNVVLLLILLLFNWFRPSSTVASACLCIGRLYLLHREKKNYKRGKKVGGGGGMVGMIGAKYDSA
jgi:hypothetical protein